MELYLLLIWLTRITGGGRGWHTGRPIIPAGLSCRAPVEASEVEGREGVEGGELDEEALGREGVTMWEAGGPQKRMGRHAGH